MLKKNIYQEYSIQSKNRKIVLIITCILLLIFIGNRLILSNENCHNLNSHNGEFSVFLCQTYKDFILVDEISNLSKSKPLINFDINNFCHDLVAKYPNTNLSFRETFFFNKYYDDFYRFTKLKIGDNIYVSTINGTVKTEVIGYAIQDVYDGYYSFYCCLKKLEEIEYFEKESDNVGEDVRNIRVCSKSPKIKATNTTFQFSVNTQDNISKSINDYKNTIPTELIDDGREEFIKIYNGSFLNVGKNEFLVFYYRVLKAVNYVNYEALSMFISDSKGKYLKKIHESEFKEHELSFDIIGVLDVDGDGLQELFVEGHGYEYWVYAIWKLKSDGGYNILTFGFSGGS